jgi:hypothetical protein
VDRISLIKMEESYMNLLIGIVKEFNRNFVNFKCRLQIEDSLDENDIFNKKETCFDTCPEGKLVKFKNYITFDQFNFEHFEGVSQ